MSLRQNKGRPRLLITGASGLLGWQLCRQAAARWEVFGLYCRNRPQFSGMVSLRCDLTSGAALAETFASVAPQAVIHAAAVSRSDHCRKDPETSFKVNVEASARLAGLCAAHEVEMVFVSTDLVFDGCQAPYSEDSPVSPATLYGQQKALAEERVLEHWPRAAVCRLPLLFGWAPGRPGNFTLEVISLLAAGRPVELFVDQFRTPLDTASAARGLLQFLGHWQGRLHLAGATRISRYQMGRMIASLMGQSTALVKPARMADFHGSEKPVPDVSLNSSAARQAGFRPAALEQGLRKTIKETISHGTI